MNDKKPKFHFCFDIKNNKEVGPYLFFSDLAAFSFANSFFTQNLFDFQLENFMIEAISTLNEYLNPIKDQENKSKRIKKYIKKIFIISEFYILQTQSTIFYN